MKLYFASESVLEPFLFSLYTGELERIVRKYKLGFHPFDDTQLYGHCNNNGTKKMQIRVFECVDGIAAWMGANCLKLNSEKTEVIWFSSRRNLKNIPSYSVRVLESNILLSKSVRNLGISMDRDLTMSTQIPKTTQVCFTSASNKIHQGTFDSGLLEDTCISLSVKSY